MLCIDLHAHDFPTEYLDALDESGTQATAICRDCQAGEDPADPAARFDMMDAAGVDVQVVSAVAAPPYFEDEADAVAAARLGNDLQAELVDAHRSRLRATGWSSAVTIRTRGANGIPARSRTSGTRVLPRRKRRRSSAATLLR